MNRLLTLLSLAALLSAGCASTAPTVAYKTAQTATITVEAAVQLWDGFIADHHPGIDAETKVRAAYERYRTADTALLLAGAALLALDPHTAAAADIAAAENTRQTAADALAAAAADAFALLKTLGLKLP